MSYAGTWSIDPGYLRNAIEKWVRDHHPTDFERAQVDAWVKKAQDGPFGAGSQDPDERTLFRGRVPGTNLVVVYAADDTYRKIMVGEIVVTERA